MNVATPSLSIANTSRKYFDINSSVQNYLDLKMTLKQSYVVLRWLSIIYINLCINIYVISIYNTYMKFIFSGTKIKALDFCLFIYRKI